MFDNLNKFNEIRIINKILIVCYKFVLSVLYNLVLIKLLMNMSIDERNILCFVLKCVVS